MQSQFLNLVLYSVLGFWYLWYKYLRNAFLPLDAIFSSAYFVDNGKKKSKSYVN